MTTAKKPRPKRLRWILAVGAALVAVACFYLVFFQWRPIGSGPAGPPVPSEPFQHAWSEREVLLLGIGDSATAGLGAQSPDHSYFNRLLRNPADEYDDMPGRCLSAVLPNLKSLNLAVSGSTSIMHQDIEDSFRAATIDNVRHRRDDNRRQRSDSQLWQKTAEGRGDVRSDARTGPPVDRELPTAGR